MIVSDNTIQVECSGDFFKSLGKTGFDASRETAKIVLETGNELWILLQLLLVQLLPETLIRLYQLCLK